MRPGVCDWVRRRRAAFGAVAVLLLPLALRSGTESVSIETCRGTLRLASPSPGAVRVTRGESVRPEFVLTAVRPQALRVRESAEAVRVSSGALTAVVSRATGLVSFEGARGRILSEVAVGDKTVAFDSPAGERLYGLGQFQDGALDVRNLPRRLVQVNTQISVPFLVSTRGWGLYWHTYAKVDFNPCDAKIALAKSGEGAEKIISVTTGGGGAKEARREVFYAGAFTCATAGEYAFLFDCGREMARRQTVEIDGTVVVDNRNFWLPPAVGFRVRLAAGRHTVRLFASKGDAPSLAFRPARDETRFRTDSPRAGTDYIVYAGAPDAVVSRFRADTGGTAALPDWAWGYWHCQERYRSQADLLRAVRWFTDRRLPLSVIVQDWLWWRSGTWNSMEWDAARFPDPRAMTAACHAAGVKVMLSVWSRTQGATPFRAELESVNGLVPGTDWIDFSNRAACDVYWKWFDRCCVQNGIDAFWLDAVEPENDALRGRRLALGSGDVYRNIYPLLVNLEADRRLRRLRPGETPLVLTRCAFAGQQRTASVVWSGDVGSGWADFRKQIVAGLGCAMAGLPYWTSDCGGFFRPANQYANAAYHKVYARWMQFATFCPIQRVHGYQSDTTPSRFGPTLEKILCEQIRLRDRLKPYIRETAAAVVSRNALFLRPLWEAPEGFETQYLFGPDILVCPVTADVTEMDVWLPPGTWTDFHTGAPTAGGRVLRVQTPIDRIPVFVRPSRWPSLRACSAACGYSRLPNRR